MSESICIECKVLKKPCCFRYTSKKKDKLTSICNKCSNRKNRGKRKIALDIEYFYDAELHKKVIKMWKQSDLSYISDEW